MSFTRVWVAGAPGREERELARCPRLVSAAAIALVAVVGFCWPLPSFASSTARVSVASDGSQSNGLSFSPSMSTDGRYVAFDSWASNLVASDTNAFPDVFVHDCQTGVTERVSVGSDGAQANDVCHAGPISADGRYVTFWTRASNLVPGDSSAAMSIFVHDRQTGQTEVVSVATGGGRAWRDSYLPAITADGRYVAFTSCASNLVAADTNSRPDAFVHDRQTGDTERVSVASGGTEGNNCSSPAAISGDGRYVVLASCASNLVAWDTNARPDVFLHDRQMGYTERWSVASDGTQSGDCSSWAAISADGSCVAFESPASNLVAGDTNAVYDVFVRQRPATDFVGIPISGPPPLVVSFTDLSVATPSGPAIAWDWDFGDGATSTEQNPGHSYDSLGVYTVSLTVTREGGSDTETKQRYICVTFSDVPIGYWAIGQILACVDAGIVGGYPNGTYRPTNPVDRASMAVFISRALVIPSGDAGVPEGPPTPTFPADVPTDHWAYKYVEFAAAQNVVGGYGGGMYKPDLIVDRGQMAVFIARALVAPTGDAAVPDGPPDPTFPDVTPTNAYAWCYKHVEYIAAEGVVGGYDDGKYHPERIVTRDQMAVFVQRAFELPM